jgi:hypothetical protein
MLSLSLALVVASAQSVELPPRFYELMELTERPITAYLPVDPSQRPHLSGDALVLYMNRFGGSYTCGNNSLDNDAAVNKSSIACAEADGVADITPYQGSDADWGAVMSCLTDLFAPFNLPVTDVEPLAESGIDYVEAVIGGSPEQAGMEGSVGGVAPYSCGVIPGAVVYAFADVYGDDVRGICETAAQEIAHAFGLDHEFLCQDPMTYLGGCGDKAFVDQYVPCGEFEPRECSCETPTQNSVAAMMELFGPANGTTYNPPVDIATPRLHLLSPADGAILPANSAIEIVIEADDDVGFSVVELEWDFSGERMFCPAEGGSYTCAQGQAPHKNRYTWTVNVGVGNRTFRAHVRDVVGNERTSDDVSIWLSEDGSGPPNDTTPPTIVLGTPMPGAVLPTESGFDIVATFLDDNGIARAEMNWPRRGEARWFPCPYEDFRMTCAVEGNTYRWTINSAREGERIIGFRATDVVGNDVEIGDIRLEMHPAAPAVVSDGNDGIDEAQRVSCGDTIDFDGTDADWFTIDAPAGDTVTLTAAEGGFNVFATDGKQLFGDGARSLKHTVAATGPLSFVVTPPNSLGGATKLTIDCVSPEIDEPKPESCAYAGFPSLLAMLTVAFRLRVRRRS